jgi:broad specificity phosphatase PhoE/predicted GNAT family N-acyltransferase
MPRLLLVRHAQSDNNVSNDRVRAEYQDDLSRVIAESERLRAPDPELSELGRRQADLLADHLAPLLAEPDTMLVSSPMRRALQTATPLGVRANLPRERFICERELYEVGGCYYLEHAQPSATAAQLEAEFPVSCNWPSEQEWFAGHSAPESMDDVRARVERVILWVERLLDRGPKLVIIVAHGDLLTRWLRRWLGVPWPSSMAFVHANTGITSLAHDRTHGLLLESLNAIGHLPTLLHSGHGEGWWRYVSPELEISRVSGWSALTSELAAALLELRAKLFEPEQKRASDYAESDARSVHFIARGSGQVAGYVQYDPANGRLRQLIVDARFRGMRLGRRLVAAVEAEARRQGQSELRVHAWAQSRDFYRAMGFVAFGDLVEGPGVAWQAMHKTLD